MDRYIKYTMMTMASFTMYSLIILLMLFHHITSSTIETRFQASCGKDTQSTLTGYTEYTVRSRVECVALCGQDGQCMSVDYHIRTKRCLLISAMDPNCEDQIEVEGGSVLQMVSLRLYHVNSGNSTTLGWGLQVHKIPLHRLFLCL